MLGEGLSPLTILSILLFLVASGIVYAFKFSGKGGGLSTTNGAKASSDDGSSIEVNLADEDDTVYLIHNLGPESTHMDVLLAIATTPASIALTQQLLDKIDDMKQQILQKRGIINGKNIKSDASSKNKANDTMEFAIDDHGWDEDDENDDAIKRAREEEARIEKEKQQLAEATGDTPMEGIDEGVLGQLWVERTLERFGQWPPKDLRFLKDKTFPLSPKGKNKNTSKKQILQVKAMDHPAIRRNLCYTTGRINSIVLNTNAELLEASSKKLIDQTYFKANLDYRQRAGLLLEASLRIAVAMNSYRLAKTIVETVAMFKIGVSDPSSPKTLEWFRSIMTKQYTAEGSPHLAISNLKVEPPTDEKEIIPGDSACITLTMERTHAESFTKIKVAQCQQQGIPPQIALQTYREGWWLFIRLEPESSEDIGTSLQHNDNENNPLAPLLSKVSDEDKEKFAAEAIPNRLVVAWPMIVQNMAQASGSVKVQFPAPAAPGRYKLHLAIKSQEFLGTDQDFELPFEVLDASAVQRAPKPKKTFAPEEDAESANEASKKDQ